MVAHEDKEVDKTGAIYLAALGFKELVEVIVAERGVLDVNLSYNAYLDLVGVGSEWHFGELLYYLNGCFIESGVAEIQLGELVCPDVDELVGIALVIFVGAHLIGKEHQQVGIADCGDKLRQKSGCKVEAGVLFKACQVKGDNGHLLHTALFQSLSDKVDIVGGTAAAA